MASMKTVFQLTVDGVDLRVPSLSHLVALKLYTVTNNAERSTKDLADIAELLRANSDAVSTSGHHQETNGDTS
jgi:predicted nucleotidyltransferase